MYKMRKNITSICSPSHLFGIYLYHTHVHNTNVNLVKKSIIVDTPFLISLCFKINYDINTFIDLCA